MTLHHSLSEQAIISSHDGRELAATQQGNPFVVNGHNAFHEPTQSANQTTDKHIMRTFSNEKPYYETLGTYNSVCSVKLGLTRYLEAP